MELIPIIVVVLVIVYLTLKPETSLKVPKKPFPEQEDTMRTNIQPMNPALYKLHRVFYVAYFVFISFALIYFLVSFLLGTDSSTGADSSSRDFFVLYSLMLLPIGILHWFAAQGVMKGKKYGRLLSRIIGTLWLFGFPIFTVLGIYVWLQKGKNG